MSSNITVHKKQPFYFRFFIFLVMVPGVILSLIALRTINRETIYLEKQLRDNLSLELSNACTITKNVLDEMKSELDSITDNSNFLYEIDTSESIIQVVYQLSEKRDIVRPVYEARMSRNELDFSGIIRIFSGPDANTVYTNIALAFADESEEKGF